MRRLLAFGAAALPVAGAVIGALLTTPETPVARAQTPPAASPVWAVDLVRTKPGMQQEYLRGVSANWAGARAIAKREGAIRSYLALTAERDSARGWDVLLLTEYADSGAYAQRENTFARIFASAEYVATRFVGQSGKATLRDFAISDVRMQLVAR